MVRHERFASSVLVVLALSFLPVTAQAQRAAVGDLVEFVSGLGPTLAEIETAPDAAGYVVIALPTGKKVPVNTSKLRLIQRAGTPNAAMPVGEAVVWRSGGVAESGSVTKVNGKWCQVKSADVTTIGWLECSSLQRTGAPDADAGQASAAKPAAPAQPHNIKLLGNWENADGTVKLEMQAGNKCFMSFGPMTGKCTYRKTAEGVIVNMDGEDMILLANEDGSLSSKSDADALMPIRLKRK